MMSPYSPFIQQRLISALEEHSCEACSLASLNEFEALTGEKKVWQVGQRQLNKKYFMVPY